MRKPTQTTVSPGGNDFSNTLYAPCANGIIWDYYLRPLGNKTWQCVEEILQDGDDFLKPVPGSIGDL